MKPHLRSSLAAVCLIIFVSLQGARAEQVRFVQIIKSETPDTRFHLGEVEAFANGVVPDELGGGSFGGLTTSTNDVGDGTLTTFGDGNLLPDVGTTTALEHGGANKNPNNALEAGGAVWSTANGQATNSQYTLDLGSTVDVTTVRMWPRADGCCAQRWQNLEVHLYADDGAGSPGALIASNTSDGLAPGGNVPLEFAFLPGSIEVDDIVLDPALTYPTENDVVILSSAGLGALVGNLSALNEFGAPVAGAEFSLEAGAGDTDNGSYDADGPELQLTGDISGLDNAPQTVRVRATTDEGFFEEAISFTVVLDSDNDGLIDDWEEMFGAIGDFEAGEDKDMDGVDDEVEFTLGTNPDDPDSDDDGSSDGEEIANGTGPLDDDSDDDNLLDGAELDGTDNIYTGADNSAGAPGDPTDPLDADSDNDGIEDGDEVSGANGFVTNPALADTDDDGVDDGVEVEQMTDPTDADDTPVLWTVRNARSGVALNTIQNVRDLFGPGGNITEETMTQNVTINFRENADGPFPDPVAFPVVGTQGTDSNDFAILATGTIVIDEAGIYTFGFNSDDGGGLWIDGQEVVIFDANRGSGTSLGAITLGIGLHDVEFIYWERGGGAQVQLFVHNEIGDFTAAGVDNATVVANYHLLETSAFPPDDTDGDDIPDAYEESFFPGDLTQLGPGDLDGDTLSDLDEFNQGTNPTERDTDMDGLDDNVEDGGGTFVGELMTGTDPLTADTDGDGIGDGDEVAGTNGFFTNPTKADTDEDGFDDGFEVANNSDPTDPNSRPAVAIITLIDGLLGGDLTDPEDDANDTIACILPNCEGLNVILSTSDTADEGWSPGDAAGNEKSYDIFDNKVGGGEAKWCCNGAPINATVEFEEPVSLTHFTITSGNDTPARDPLDWEIQGSNDGVNFEPIFTQSDDTAIWTARNQTARVDLPSASDAYKFIRYDVTRTGNANHQINEIEYFGEVGAIAIAITDIVYDQGNETFDITWTSKEGKTYGLFYSFDLSDWGADINDSINAAVGEPTTTESFGHPDPGAREIFFRVLEN